MADNDRSLRGKLLTKTIALMRLAFSYVVTAMGTILLVLAFKVSWSQPITALLAAFGSTLLSTGLLSVFFDQRSRRLLKQDLGVVVGDEIVERLSDPKWQQELRIVVGGEIDARLNDPKWQQELRISIGELMGARLNDLKWQQELGIVVGHEMDARLNDLRSQLKNFSQARIVESGIIDCKNLKAEHHEVEELLAGATERIRVCKTWIPERAYVREGVRDALKRSDKLEVQILCLDPNSSAARQRGIDYCEDANYARNQITEDLNNLCLFFKNEGLLERVAIHIYENLPAVSLYSADNLALLGWYWHGNLALAGPVLTIMGKDSHMTKKVHQNFEDLWKKSKKYEYQGG